MSSVNEWPMVTLGDVCTLDFGAAFKSSQFNTEGRGLPVIRIRDVNRGFSATFYEGDFEARYLVTNGDFLIGMDGNFSIAEWNGGQALLNQRVCRVARDTADHVHPRYIFHFLPQALVEIHHRKSFVTVKHLSAKDLRELKIPLPPLAEQQRIAEILDQVENIQKLNEEQDQLLSSRLGHSLIFELTSLNAPSVKLSDISTISSGSTPSRKKSGYYGGSIPWVKTNEVNGREIFDTEEKLTELGLKESSCKIYPAGTVLIAMYGQGATRGQAGLLGVRAATNQACASVVPHDLEDSEFIFEALKANYEQLRSLGRGGTQPNLNLSLVKDFQIPYPSKEQRQEFRERIAAVHKIKLMNAERLAKLTEISQALKTRAFAGQL